MLNKVNSLGFSLVLLISKKMKQIIRTIILKPMKKHCIKKYI